MASDQPEAPQARPRCFDCGNPILTRGPAAGMCETCEDVDKVLREAEQAEYERELQDLEFRREHGEFYR